MKKVILGFSEYYGSAFMTYNAHVFKHFPGVAAYFGSLQDVSAYPFENYLGKLKKFITSSHDPLVSLVKGIHRSQGNLDNSEDLQSMPPVCTKAPNNIYVDVKAHKVYEAAMHTNNIIKMKE